MIYIYKDDGKTNYFISIWKLTNNCTLPNMRGLLD